MRHSARRRNQNLTSAEAAQLRAIAAYHGYTQRHGRGAGQGSVMALTLAIVDGEVATVQIDSEELRPLVAWLRARVGAESGVLAETIASLADQLATTLPEAAPGLIGPDETGPINTLEG